MQTRSQFLEGKSVSDADGDRTEARRWAGTEQGITGGCQLTQGEAGHSHNRVRAVRPAQQVGEVLLRRRAHLTPGPEAARRPVRLAQSLRPATPLAWACVFLSCAAMEVTARALGWSGAADLGLHQLLLWDCCSLSV